MSCEREVHHHLSFLSTNSMPEIILAALLLSVIYQCLIGLGDRGGAEVYSSGSLAFRSTHISIVLFQGAYVWIKFRDVAPPSRQKPSPGLYRKSEVNEKSGVKVYIGNYEPRFKPFGSRDGYISVGSYEEEQDAKTMYQILAFYYGKGEGELHLVGDDTYHIPPMTEEEQLLSGLEKRQCVKGKAKDVYKDYKLRMESIVLGWLREIETQSTGIVGRMDSSGAQAEADLFLGNQSDDIGSLPPGNCSPDVGPVTQGMQHMPNDTLSDHVVGTQQSDARDDSQLSLPDSSTRSLSEIPTNIPANGAAVPGQQPLELQLQLESLQDSQASNSAINAIPDYLSLLREVKELQRQQQLQQLRSQQQESQILESERERQLQQLQSQQQESRSQQQESRISELERERQLQQLRCQQQESRISELEGEFERVRSPEHVRKRHCFGLTLRHDL